MSVREDKIKANSMSFSDQISSRLHRWVQRTTSKVRNEKERSQSVRIEHRDTEEVKENAETGIKKCTRQENFAKKSRESRSYEELEKALSDLINNCVSNSSVVEEFSNPTCALAQDNANINITRENNNNTEFAPTYKTNNDIGIETRKDSVDGAESACSSGADSKQESENKNSGILPVSLLHCKDKQTDVDGNLTSGVRKVCLEIDENEDFNAGLVSSGENERNIEHERKFIKDSRHSTKSSEISGVNTSLNNVNKGLNAGSDIARSCLKASSVQMKENPAEKLNKKPPLRRIQSEGDALELRLSFQDSDVTEFAATCIRHAQKKRFSDITPMLSKPNFVHETIEDKNGNSSTKSFIPKEDILAPNSEEISNMFERIPEMQLDQTDYKHTRQAEHIPLTERPSSLSFPLDTRKRVKTKSGSLKNKATKSSSSSFPRSTPSPKFRKFPSQPVFYVPLPTESRTGPKNTRSGSVGEQSNVEYLI